MSIDPPGLVFVVGLFAYYIGSRMFLIVDAIFVEGIDPFVEEQHQERWPLSAIPVCSYVWPCLGEILLVLTIFK